MKDERIRVKSYRFPQQSKDAPGGSGLGGRSAGDICPVNVWQPLYRVRTTEPLAQSTSPTHTMSRCGSNAVNRETPILSFSPTEQRPHCRFLVMLVLIHLPVTPPGKMAWISMVRIQHRMLEGPMQPGAFPFSSAHLGVQGLMGDGLGDTQKADAFNGHSPGHTTIITEMKSVSNVFGEMSQPKSCRCLQNSDLERMTKDLHLILPPVRCQKRSW